MNLILNLNDVTVRNIQGFCDAHHITAGELLERLFNENIKEPDKLD